MREIEKILSRRSLLPQAEGRYIIIVDRLLVTAKGLIVYLQVAFF